MAARHSGREVCIIPPTKERAFLGRLPLSVLPQPDAAWREMQRRLRLLGLRTLGDVAALGRVAMQAQFGLPGLEAWRLAVGEAGPLQHLAPKQEIGAKCQFEASLISGRDLEMALAGLAEELADRLRREGRACTALDVIWQVEGMSEERRHVRLKEPVAAKAIIQGAALRCLEGAIAGPVMELGLRAQAVAPQVGKQMSLLERGQAKAKLERVAAELKQRLGQDALLRVKFLGPSHLEERGYAFAGG